MLTTKAYAYNEAIRQLAKGREITLDEIPDAEHAKTADDLDGWNKEACDFITATRASGKTAYLQLVEDELSRIVGRDIGHNTGVAYGSSKHVTATATVKLYEEMAAAGWLPFADVTADMDGKKALLTGQGDYDFLTVKKEGETITIVAREGLTYGYKKPRQRNHYHIPSYEGKWFVKLV
ncbi:MAG: hypothetical protein M0R06_06855 [Sphaerochaeta sp.]|jgi:hypothetical protein|nr:hypothetical protein [Sphaerochaeta sp.]